MHLRLSAAVLTLCTLMLAGCAALQNNASAPASGTSAAEDSRLPEAYREQIARVIQRMRAACIAEDYQPYFRKTACLPSGITDEMTADRTRITAQQKRAAQAVFALTHELNEETRRIMTGTQDAELAAQAEASRRVRDPQISALQNDLLSGKITWGEYNAGRRSLSLSSSR